MGFAKDIEQLHDIWSRYHDDLSCPQYDEKPTFLPEELTNFGPCTRVPRNHRIYRRCYGDVGSSDRMWEG